MRVLVVGLPPPSVGWGGEDQIARFIFRELHNLGHESFISHENELKIAAEFINPDLVISLNALASCPFSFKGRRHDHIFWNFNERASYQQIKSLGWDRIATNSRVYQREFNLPFLPLGCDITHGVELSSIKTSSYVGYVGNWHMNKTQDEVRRYLIPLAKAGILKIFGSPKWATNEPDLKESYQGVIQPSDWPFLSQKAQLWVNWRTTGQKNLEMLNDRVFAYLAAGVRVVSDFPKEDEICDQVSWLKDEEWLDGIVNLLSQTGSFCKAEMIRRASTALRIHSYGERAKSLLRLAYSEDCHGT